MSERIESKYTPTHHMRDFLNKECNLCQKDIDIITEEFSKNIDLYRRPNPPPGKLFIPFRKIIDDIAEKKGVNL